MSMVHASARPQQAGVGASAAASRRSSPAWPGRRSARAPWSIGTNLSPTTTVSATRSRPSSRSSRATMPASAQPGGFHLASTRARARLATRVRQGQFPGLRRARRGSAAERSGCPLADHDPQPRPVQHDALLAVRPLSRRLRPARRGVPQRIRRSKKRGFAAGDRVDLDRRIERRRGAGRARFPLVVSYTFPTGSCAAYYPETNPLVPLYAHDPMSFTPSYKGIPIRLVRSARLMPQAPSSTNRLHGANRSKLQLCINC